MSIPALNIAHEETSRGYISIVKGIAYAHVADNLKTMVQESSDPFRLHLSAFAKKNGSMLQDLLRWEILSLRTIVVPRESVLEDSGFDMMPPTIGESKSSKHTALGSSSAASSSSSVMPLHTLGHKVLAELAIYKCI